MNTVNILIFGDVIGSMGRAALKQVVPQLKKEHDIHFSLVNVENAAHGFGMTTKIYNELTEEMGFDCLTSGNHIWDKKEFIPEMNRLDRVLRPLNYPKRNPGKGFTVLTASNGVKVGIMNVMGRVFMPGSFDDPFAAVNDAYEQMKTETPVILLDIHAETTSEKTALGHYLDGKASMVWGTHTHVQTSDERILAGGTGFLTDVGMTGGIDGVIGMQKAAVIEGFLTGRKAHFDVVDKGQAVVCGLVVQIDSQTGRCIKLERVNRTLNK
jgi:metallophosphoesterase (TIGR00282 family)